MYSREWINHLPEIAGAIVGLAVFNEIYLDLRLHPLIYRFFIKQSVDVSFDDLSTMHPTLHRSLVLVKKASDVRSLGLSWTVRLPGADAETVLAHLAGKAGDAIIETPDDAASFAAAYAEAAMVGAAKSRIASFMRAAVDRMAFGKAYTLCTAHDLELLICGSLEIGDFGELEKHCKYANGFDSGSPTVRLFGLSCTACPKL
eukprot:SRR837773.8835.p1 GENE.SRR837773.8835~~SRR837773.8835.p1  ORF type:complete len:202 (+),score=18.29 SRR837773.8835:231-836(+)